MRQHYRQEIDAIENEIQKAKERVFDSTDADATQQMLAGIIDLRAKADEVYKRVLYSTRDTGVMSDEREN